MRSLRVVDETYRPPVPDVHVSWQRAVGLLVDCWLVALVQWMAARLLVPVHLHVSHGVVHLQAISIWFDRPTWQSWPALLPTLVLYFIVFELCFATTPGKALARLRVIARTGERASPLQIVIRDILLPIDALGGFIVGALFMRFSPMRQRVGDRVAGTVVVRAGSVPWTDLSPAVARRRTIICAAILLAALIVSVGYSYVTPVPMTLDSSRANAPAVVDSSAPTMLYVPGAHRVRAVSLHNEHRSGATLTYDVRYVVEVGRRNVWRSCNAHITLSWQPWLVRGWFWNGVQYDCLGHLSYWPLG